MKMKNNKQARRSESTLIAILIPAEVVASVVKRKRTCAYQTILITLIQ
jgi:hypothetical protein